jgi:hypothetical protein
MSSSVSRAEERDAVGKDIAVIDEADSNSTPPPYTSNKNGSKEEISSLIGIDDVAAIPKGTIDPVYEAKARVLNRAVCFLHYSRDSVTDILQIQEIGMGKYNWQLFIVVGFGWANDNMWPIVTSLIRKSL